MTQKSLHWNASSIGDANALTIVAPDGIGYRLGNEDYKSPTLETMFRMVFNGTGDRGVLYGWLNDMATTGVATPVVVDTGGAIVYGMLYENTSAVNVVVPSPTNDTRQDYIVLRRDWEAQTIRITRIAGIEAGGVPALTQSPSPDGSGIYDIPLATISITVGGVITVTDARDWVTFSTVPVDDSLETAHFVNESADLAARATRTKNVFLGGGDFRPTGNIFSYSATGDMSLASGSAWGSAAATEEGWKTAGTPDYGFMGAFKLPDDYAGGDVITRIWWMDDCGAALSIYWRSSWQAYGTAGELASAGGYTSTYVSGTYATGEVYRASARTITDVSGDELIYYACQYYNTAGTEALLFLGLELEYTGYL